jgi:hypothetical protein
MPPHAVQRLLLHAKPVPHGFPPGQQAWPLPPHGAHWPVWQERPAVVHVVPPQQG